MSRLIAYDTFTESGTAFVAVKDHTPEVGAAWSDGFGASPRFFVDPNNDYVTCDYSVAYGGVAWMTSALGWNQYATCDIGFFGGTASSRIVGPALRYILGSNNCYLALGFANGNLVLYRLTSGAYTALVTATSVTNAASRKIRFQAVGSSPTTLRARMWDAANAEPTTWNIDTTDNTAANQTANPAACAVYVETGGSTRTNYSYLDNLVVAGDGPVIPTTIRQAVTRAAVF